ncbi:MAG: hypothetical protein QOE45_520 [Frankiaceae bacterium]|jgi:hypothetical protein|nr:hypothetical protein [Frankiaceae bacterium]
MSLSFRWAGTAVVAASALALSTPALGAPGRAPAPTPLALAQHTAERVGTTLATGVGPLSSDNVELLTTVPGSAAGMRIVGKYAYVTGWSGLTILDISTPAAPKVVSVLPIAHFENEDVESDGKIVLIANDREKENKGGALYVVDVTNPASPALASVLSLSQITSTERGPGHIANCVKDGCKWVWLTGGNRVWVVDLRDVHNPLLAGAFASPTSAGSAGFGTPGKIGTGATHDAERDATGTVWVTGSGGAAAYSTKDPVHPKLLATTGKQGTEEKVNDFILHNAIRPSATSYKKHAGNNLAKGDVLLVTEEDYVDTGETPPGGCRGQGKFQTWDVRGHESGRTMGLLDQWLTEVEGVPLLNGSKAPVTANCSSHWFRERGGIAAVGWYEQGLRLLDTRNPKDIRQVGYWLPPNGVAWGAYWVTDDIVYTADVARGIDVLRVKKTAGPAPTVVAPIRASWLGAAPAKVPFFGPSSVFGYACLTPRDSAA